jgi:acyl carrier protein
MSNRSDNDTLAGNATEKTLAAIWTEVLGSAPSSEKDAFLDLGGDSLSATHCIARVRDECGIELTLDDLCGSGKTFGSLVVQIAQGHHLSDKPSSRVEPYSDSDELSVTINQEKRLIREEQRHLAGRALRPFNLLSILRLEGSLNIPVLELVLNAVIARHDMLRASFIPTSEIAEDERHARGRTFLERKHFVPGMFRYRIEPKVDFTLTIHDSTPGGSSDGLEQIIKHEARITMVGVPKLKATLVAIAEKLHVLILVVPHLVADARSMDIIRSDIQHLYPAILSDRNLAVPFLSHHFSEFARLQHEYINSDRVDPAIAFWTRQWSLFGSERLTLADISKHKGSPKENSHSNGYVHVTLGEKETQLLRGFASSSGATLFMLLSLTFCLSLSASVDKKMIAIWVNFANRSQADFEEVVGWFVNSHLLGFDLRDDVTFLELLYRIRTQVFNAITYQQLPLTHLWNVLQKAPVPDEVFILFDFQARGEAKGFSPIQATEIPLTSYLIPRMRRNTLEIRVNERAAALNIELLFNASDLSHAGMNLLLREWCRIALHVSQNPLSRVSQLQIC